jgi:general stress protein 26
MRRDEIVAYIQQVRFGYLATAGADNAPHVRPIGIYNVYGDNLYWFTLSNTRKVGEIEANPQVEVVWSKLQEQSQVRISGKMVVEEDEAIIQQFKADNPIVAQLLPDAVQHLFRLYKLQPVKVYWAKGMVPYTEVAW